jgi:hypothetical protein
MQEFECLGRAERLACRDTLMWGGWGIGTGKQALAPSSHVISSQTGGLSELDRSFCCWNVLILFGRCTTRHNTIPAISYLLPKIKFQSTALLGNYILWRSFVSCICRAPKYAYFYVLTEKFRLQLANITALRSQLLNYLCRAWSAISIDYSWCTIWQFSNRRHPYQISKR